MLCTMLEARSFARKLRTANVGTAGKILINIIQFVHDIFYSFLFLDDAMCDMAAALNPASQGVSGWLGLCWRYTNNLSDMRLGRSLLQ